ncbi:MAG: hypothetical protein ACYCYK_09960 [Candidatus Dormibacteria bacterium]
MHLNRRYERPKYAVAGSMPRRPAVAFKFIIANGAHPSGSSRRPL